MEVLDILAHQRNRYPVLFLDRLDALDPGRRAVGKKCFTYNEWYFPAHFDDDPNVPGFVLIECMVQVFIMTFLCLPEYKGMKTNFVSANRAKFTKKIIPGDVLFTTATLQSLRRGVAVGSAEGFVDGKLACAADFTVVLPEVLKRFTPVKAHGTGAG